MSIVRFAFTFLISATLSGSAIAQTVTGSDSGFFIAQSELGILIEPGRDSGSVGLIQDTIKSLGLNATLGQQHGGNHVATNLAEHPVHAIRRRKKQEEILKALRPKTLIATAKDAGLHGQWYVLAGKKDGRFSQAQIGQQPGDVISMESKENAGKSFVFG